MREASAGGIFRSAFMLLDGSGNGASLAAYWRWCSFNSFVDLLGLAAVIPVIGLVVEPELMALQCRCLRVCLRLRIRHGIGFRARNVS